MTDNRKPPAGPRRIRILVVEDSPSARDLLIHILESDPEIEVTAAVGSGEEALAAVDREKPDLITMDIHLPRMNGLEATRRIMETTPVPIVIITGSRDMLELESSFKAIEAGALVVLQKPVYSGHRDHERQVREIISKVKLMSEIKVVRRWSRPPSRQPVHPAVEVAREQDPVQVVAIGASTGGPPVIQKILAELPRDFPPTILIVQHMAEGFIRGFAEWLGQTSVLPVHVAFHGSTPRAGHVYIAPDKVQMKISASGRLLCLDEGAENGLLPSVSCLFRSVAEVYGKHAAGVLLTGMGKDGAKELRLLREKGAVTIAQNEETSAVFGMPGEAIRLEAARYVLPADKIATVLASLVMAKAWKNRG